MSEPRFEYPSRTALQVFFMMGKMLVLEGKRTPAEAGDEALRKCPWLLAEYLAHNGKAYDPERFAGKLADMDIRRAKENMTRPSQHRTLALVRTHLNINSSISLEIAQEVASSETIDKTHLYIFKVFENKLEIGFKGGLTSNCRQRAVQKNTDKESRERNLTYERTGFEWHIPREERHKIEQFLQQQMGKFTDDPAIVGREAYRITLSQSVMAAMSAMQKFDIDGTLNVCSGVDDCTIGRE